MLQMILDLFYCPETWIKHFSRYSLILPFKLVSTFKAVILIKSFTNRYVDLPPLIGPLVMLHIRPLYCVKYLIFC